MNTANTAMKPARRIWARLAMSVALAAFAFVAWGVWNKHHFCQGWSNHYAARAKQFRTDAANPVLKPEEVRECLIAADVHDIISRKYAVVASRPWRPYPGYPLVTRNEHDGRR